MTPRVPGGTGWFLATGLLVPLAFPFVWPWDPSREVAPGGALDLVAFVALVPLLRAAVGGGTGRAFGLGWGAGLVAFPLIFYWLHVAMTTFGGLPAWEAVGAVVLLAAWCALFWGLATALAVAVRRELGWPLWAGLPVAWVGAELLRAHLLTGFPWAHLGYSLARTPLFLQLAALGGVHAVAALVALVNGALAEVWLARVEGGRRRSGRSAATVAVGALLVAAGWGAWRLHVVARAGEEAPRLSVAVVQGNVDQRIKNAGRREASLILASYVPPSAAAAEAGADLVIWPESALPGAIREDREAPFQRRSLSPLLGTGAHYLLSATTWRTVDGQLRRRNAAFLVDDRLSVAGRYDKQHLVPFGEYVPLHGILPLEKVVPVAGRFEAGPHRDSLGLGPGGPSVGTSICFDGLFPEVPLALSPVPDLLVNQSNDAWYGRTSAPHQFLRIVAVRAVEGGRWLARAANTGISAIVDPAGRVVARTPLGLVADGADRVDAGAKVPPAVLAREVPLVTGVTPYRRWGDVPAWGIGALALGLAGAAARRRRRRGGQAPVAATTPLGPDCSDRLP